MATTPYSLRFINHEGKQKNSPAVRFGNIAMMNDENIVAESGVAQLTEDSDVMERNNFETLMTFMVPKGPYLLGIDFCHIYRKAFVLDKDGERIEDKRYIKENTGMAGVIPAWKVADVLNSEELSIMRQIQDDEMSRQKKDSGVSLDRETNITPEHFTKEDFEAALRKAGRKLSDEK